MKHGWEYKKLGEVASYINGYAFKPEQWKEDGTPIVRIQNLNNPNAPYNYYDGEVPEKVIINNGDLLISWSASLGAYIWQGGRAFLNQHIFKVCLDKTDIDKMYLKYAVTSKLDAMAGQVHGATMKHIVKKDFDNTKIPYPPTNIQQSIVSELDKINELIRLKKEQLKDYDNLAQSIFYEMFGDPAVNDKNWKVMKLGEICRNCDNLRKPITASDRIPGSIPYYGASGIVDYVEDYIFSSDYLLVSEDGANLLARTTPIAFSISGKTWVNNHAHVLEFKDSETQLYVEYLINSVDISNYITGAVQPKLNQAKLNVFPIPLPPHSLQQLFAQRIELIKQQKAEIQSTIQDLETLLASRMQYWFD